MNKKAQQESQWEKEDEELGLAPGAEFTKTVNVDLPIWAIKALDKEATRRGVARQALIKMWLVDRLDILNAKETA